MNKSYIIMGIVAVLLIGAVVLFASKSYAPSTTTTTITTLSNEPEKVGIVEVAIQNFAFTPQTIRIKAGTTVVWTNNDSTPHIVASDPYPAHTDLPGLISGTLNQGDRYTFKFEKSGTFGYHCHIHPSMKGTVVVEQ